MATITTRSGKGSPLTNNEVDANFNNLNTDKLELSGGTLTGNLSLGDNVKAQFGAGSDLQIYHDGSSRIANSTGNLIISDTDGDIYIQAKAGENSIKANNDGSVLVYFDNAEKLATTSTGIDVTGSIVADGLTVDGTATAQKMSISGIDGTAIVVGGAYAGGGRDSLLSQFGSALGDGARYSDGGYPSWEGGVAGGYFKGGASGAHGGGGVGISAKGGAGGSGEGGAGIYAAGGSGSVGTAWAGYFDGPTYVNDNLTISGSVSAPQLAITSASTADTVTLTRGTNGQNNMFKFVTGSTADWIVGERNDSTSDFRFYSYGTSSDVLSISRANGNVNIGSSLMVGSTAAPSAKIEVSGTTNDALVNLTGAGTNFELRATSGNGATANSSVYRLALDYLNGTATNGFIDFYRGGAGNDGYLAFGSSGSERLTINADGSSVFSGSVTSTGLTVNATGSAIELSQSATGSATYYTMDNTVETGGKRWRFGYSGGSSDKGSFSFYNQTDNNLALLLASSGATFSGSVTSSGNLTSINAGGNQQLVTVANTTITANLGVFNANIPNTASLTTVGAHPLAFGTANTERLRIDSQGRVGIGTSSPSAKLGINASAPDFTLLQSDAVKYRMGVSNVTNGGVTGSASGDYFARTSGGKMFFSTNDGVTAHAVIDSSGNLLVGTTNNNAGGANVVGHSFGALGYISSTRDSNWVAQLNRKTNDGDIAIFKKDGTTVGSIGARGGDVYLETGSVGLRMYDAGGSIIPVGDTGVSKDNSIDLGEPTIRFKDLYLSGTANAGRAHIKTASSGASADVSADELVVESNGNAGISILSGQSNSGSIYFGDAGVNYDGYIAYAQASRSMTFGTAAGSRMTIDSLGNVKVGSSSIQIGYWEADAVHDGYFVSYNASGQSELVNSFATGGLIFKTGTSKAERMRIDSSGRVGIGTSSPESELHISKGASGARGGTLTIENSNGSVLNNEVQIALLTDVGASVAGTANARIKVINTNAGNGAADITFTTWNGVSEGERMRITSSGNVGIGCSPPTGVRTKIKGLAEATNLATSATSAALFIEPYSGSSWGLGIGSVTGQKQYIQAVSAAGNGTKELLLQPFGGNVLVGKTAVAVGTVGTEVAPMQTKITNNAATPLLTTNQLGWGGVTVDFLYTGNRKGYIETTSTAVAYVTSSDQRLKDNIADADDAGSKVDAIQVRKFDWKADGSHQDYGMIAQELQTVAPEAVSGDADSEEMMGVDYSKLVPMLIKEIQSLRNRVAQLEE